LYCLYEIIKNVLEAINSPNVYQKKVRVRYEKRNKFEEHNHSTRILSGICSVVLARLDVM
jgi:hypothetical protein